MSDLSLFLLGLNRFHLTLCSATEDEAMDLIMVEDDYLDMLLLPELDYTFDTDEVFADSGSDTTISTTEDGD